MTIMPPHLRLVTMEVLQEHRITMFGDPISESWISREIEKLALELAEIFIIPTLCGPMGRVIP